VRDVLHLAPCATPGLRHGLPGSGGTPRTVISDRLEKLVEEMVDKGVRFEDAVNEFEKRFISRVLRDTDGSLTKTACALGMHRNTLIRKMDEYKIKRRAG
jgi:DNA-binding NtrC family response regulator